MTFSFWNGSFLGDEFVSFSGRELKFSRVVPLKAQVVYPAFQSEVCEKTKLGGVFNPFSKCLITMVGDNHAHRKSPK